MRSGFALAAALLLAGCSGTGASLFSPTHLAGVAPAAGITPDNQAALYLGAVDGLVKQERYGAALAFLDRYALTQKDPEPRYWLLRGDALLGLARNAEAVAAFGALDATPLAAQGWNGKGRAAAARKDWRGAAADFRMAVQGDPSDTDFLNNQAFADLHLGNDGDAVRALRQAHELAPGSELIRNNLVIALTLQGDRDGANGIVNSIADSATRQKLLAAIAALIAGNNFSTEKKS